MRGQARPRAAMSSTPSSPAPVDVNPCTGSAAPSTHTGESRVSNYHPLVEERAAMAVLLLLVLLTARVVLCPDPSLLEEARELSELPLDKLLHVKQAFTAPAPDTEEQPTRTVDGGGEGPEAMALTRGDVTALTSKNKSSTPTVFQGTVTTLAFLAFGGYILCLAVSAARSKSDSARGMWNTPGGGGGKGRRHRRDAMPGAEDMMLALTTLAEGYAAFHDTPSP